MIFKKVLLSILFLTAISGEVEAKGRFKLSDGQKRVLKIGGLAAAGLFLTYCGFVFGLAKLKCSHVYDHIIYWHCDNPSHDGMCKKECEKYDFKKNQFLNLEKADLEKLKAGSLPLLHDERRPNIIAIKTESEKSYEPIAIVQFFDDISIGFSSLVKGGKDSLEADLQGFLDKQISASEKHPMTFARFGDAFFSLREVAYHGTKFVVRAAQKVGLGKEKK